MTNMTIMGSGHLPEPPSDIVGSRYAQRAEPTTYASYANFEAAARRIRAYEPFFVTGTLQTPEYAWHLQTGLCGRDELSALTQLESRMGRQSLHDGPEPPQMTFVFDESVLHRQVGGPEVMRRQLEHLAQMARRDHVELRIVPFAKGAHRGMTEPIVLFNLDRGDEDDVLYLEQSDSIHPFAPTLMARYSGLFAEALALALRPADTLAVVERLCGRAGTAT